MIEHSRNVNVAAGNLIALSISIAFMLLSSVSQADGYRCSDFNYKSYKPNTSIGFYTNQSCDFINIDHVVSLKDAYDSGAASWSAYKKRTFVNDIFVQSTHRCLSTF